MRVFFPLLLFGNSTRGTDCQEEVSTKSVAIKPRKAGRGRGPEKCEGTRVAVLFVARKACRAGGVRGVGMGERERVWGKFARALAYLLLSFRYLVLSVKVALYVQC